MKSPEVFLLCEYATLNGGERSMLATLDGVRRGGFEPVVMAPSQGPLASAIARRGIELVAFECRGPDGARSSQPRLRERLAELLRRRRPPLLHANSLAMGRLSGPVASELGLRSISHLRDIVRLSAQAVADLNGHTRLLAVSEATRAFHVAAGLSAQRTHTLYNGVDLDEFRPQAPTGFLHRQLGLPPEATLIGSIGQLGLRKGQDLLLGAASQLADRWPEVHWLVVGRRCSDKEESRRFERQLHELPKPLADRVHFLGVRDDVPQLLREWTLLVHPARQEPLGRVLLEAAATGLAIVATRVGGTSEIFPDEQPSALLTPPNDETALASAVSTLLADAGRRTALGQAARRRIESQFDIQTAVAGLLRHYREVASAE
ncbi:MAG: glycosyltransferase family 4 protein [Thermoguttaceae bacterium]